MTATGIGPKPTRMIFPGGALMQQDTSVLIPNDDRYGAMLKSISVCIKFGNCSDRDIVGVDYNYVV